MTKGSHMTNNSEFHVLLLIDKISSIVHAFQTEIDMLKVPVKYEHVCSDDA